MKTQEEQVRTARQSIYRSDDAADLGIEYPTMEQESTARLAYFYWEERGRPNHSPHEDWFRAEAELRNRFAAATSG